MASAELEKRREEEYEMQLFGFHSRAVCGTLQSIAYEAIKSKCKKLCETLETTLKLQSEQLKELRINEKQLIQAYCTGALPHATCLESVVKQYVSVPKNVLSEEDKCQYKQYTNEEFEQLNTRLQTLQQRLNKANMLNAALNEELATVEQFRRNCEDSSVAMCDIVENSTNLCSDTTSMMHETIESYKELEKAVSKIMPNTQKSIYNSLGNIECEDFDFDAT